MREWVWWVAHVALGMTAGAVYLLFGRRQLAAAGEGRLQELREPRVHRAA